VKKEEPRIEENILKDPITDNKLPNLQKPLEEQVLDDGVSYVSSPYFT